MKGCSKCPYGCASWSFSKLKKRYRSLLRPIQLHRAAHWSWRRRCTRTKLAILYQSTSTLGVACMAFFSTSLWRWFRHCTKVARFLQQLWFLPSSSIIHRWDWSSHSVQSLGTWSSHWTGWCHGLQTFMLIVMPGKGVWDGVQEHLENEKPVKKVYAKQNCQRISLFWSLFQSGPSEIYLRSGVTAAILC